CMIMMVNKKYAMFMRELAGSANFREVLAPTEDQIERQRDMEYVSRFLVHTFVDYPGRVDVEEFVDDGIVSLAEANELERAKAIFDTVFLLLNEAFGGDALRR